MNYSIIQAAALIATFLFFHAIYLTIMTLHQKRGSIYNAFAFMTVIFSYLYIQICYAMLTRSHGDSTIVQLLKQYLIIRYPFAAVVMLIFLLILHVLLNDNIRKWHQTHITPMSIKAGLDSLPDGLLYYYDNGHVKLVNHTMNEMSARIFGHLVTNASDFEKELMSKEKGLTCTLDYELDHRIARFQDGRVYALEKRRQTLGNRPINEMLCFDITEEYNLTKELKMRNEELRQQHNRLTSLNDSVTEMTIDREILDTRIRIHDDLGKVLAATKYYIKTGEGSRKELLDLWRINLRLLRHEEMPPRRTGYDAILKAAPGVGVNVLIEGELPTAPEYARVIGTALEESITNTFRHASGDTLKVSVKEDDQDIICTFTNNGRPPRGEIKETGGLKNLRRLTEHVGGSMEISSQPVFILTIRLFKKNQNTD